MAECPHEGFSREEKRGSWTFGRLEFCERGRLRAVSWTLSLGKSGEVSNAVQKHCVSEEQQSSAL